jgi:hypothetical protein
MHNMLKALTLSVIATVTTVAIADIAIVKDSSNNVAQVVNFTNENNTFKGTFTGNVTPTNTQGWTQTGITGTPARIAGFLEGGSAGYVKAGSGLMIDSDDNLVVIPRNDLEINMLLSQWRALRTAGSAYWLLYGGWVDGFKDQSGINTDASSNENYQAVLDAYVNYMDSSAEIVAHYKMNDNAASTVVEDSVGDYDGTATADTSTLAVTGKVNTALSFDGVEDSVLSSAADLGLTNFTFACWVRFSDNTKAIQCALEYSTWGETTTVIGIGNSASESSPGDRFGAYIYNGTDQWVVLSLPTTTYTNGVWYHFAVVYTGTEIQFYVDGVLTDSYSITLGEAMSLSQMQVGIGKGFIANEAPTGSLAGDVDDARIYRSALSADNITFLVAATEAEITGQPPTNMILQSVTVTCATNSTLATLALFHAPGTNSIAANTDIKAYLSTDSGTNFAEVVLTDAGIIDATRKLLFGDVSISNSVNGAVYKIETTDKPVAIYGGGVLWR